MDGRPLKRVLVNLRYTYHEYTVPISALIRLSETSYWNPISNVQSYLYRRDTLTL